ncbi:MAG: hypothetical protein IJQ39_07395, partial [Thermoguttaceae bacterium]|nr:hypothetical protein [Thermoguttaceae bacterium]
GKKRVFVDFMFCCSAVRGLKPTARNIQPLRGCYGSVTAFASLSPLPPFIYRYAVLCPGTDVPGSPLVPGSPTAFHFFAFFAVKKTLVRKVQATNGSGYWQARGSADWERRLAARPPLLDFPSK